MAIEIRDPNTIHLGGPLTLINHVAAIEEITPGMILEYHNDSGVLKWGVHDSADAAVGNFVALEQDEMNMTVDEVYAAGDLVKVGALGPGSTFWGLIPSGQNITQGALLQSNGNGKLKAAGSGSARFVALESVNATADSRIRVEIVL